MAVQVSLVLSDLIHYLTPKGLISVAWVWWYVCSSLLYFVHKKYTMIPSSEEPCVFTALETKGTQHAQYGVPC